MREAAAAGVAANRLCDIEASRRDTEDGDARIDISHRRAADPNRRAIPDGDARHHLRAREYRGPFADPHTASDGSERIDVGVVAENGIVTYDRSVEHARMAPNLHIRREHNVVRHEGAIPNRDILAD